MDWREYIRSRPGPKGPNTSLVAALAQRYPGRGALDTTETNPIGTSTVYPQYLTNPSPDVSPLVSAVLDTSAQKIGRFWDAALGRAKPYTGRDLPELTKSGNEAYDAAAGFVNGTAPGVRYVRRSQTAASPFNPGAPEMAMFAETRAPRETLEQLRQYGPAAWISRGEGAVDVKDLQPAMVRALRENGAHAEYGTTAAKLAREANPASIVDSAGLWDDPSLFKIIWENVLEPRGVSAVRTSDGLIVFDPSLARRVKAP